MKLSRKPSLTSSLKENDKEVARVKRQKIPATPKKLVYISAICVGLLLSTGISFYLYQTLVVEKQIAQLRELTQQRAEDTAANIQSFFTRLTKKVEQLASNKRLITAIANDDNVTLESIKRRLQLQLSGVLAVQTFKPGEADIDAEKFPPTRFSELSLIKSAENGVTPIPEAVKVKDKWLLHIIVPIANREQAGNPTKVDGVLWVSTGVEKLTKILHESNLLHGDSSLGVARLYQDFGKRNRVLVAEYGKGMLDVSHITNVGGSQWEIEFTASDFLLAKANVDTTVAYAVLVVSIIVILVFTMLVAMLIERALQSHVARKGFEEQMLETTRVGKKSTDASDKESEANDSHYINAEILDIEISEEDERLAGISDDEEQATSNVEDEISLDDVFDMAEGSNAEFDVQFPQIVFRAYDIRGEVPRHITKEFALQLGKALGTEVQEAGASMLVVARDARTHSPELTEWLIRGVLGTGCNVLNIGTVPTPLMYFALATMEELDSGVMVTASHNAADYNGFKIVMNGITRSGDDIQLLRKKMIQKQFKEGKGQEHHHDIVPGYIDTIFSDVALAGEMNVVIDAGNGVAGKVAPRLFEELGCRVTPLYCDLDGAFPHHDPDPSVAANLADLIAKVKDLNADIGIALDGDGDRLTVVSPSGKVYFADRLLMLFAKDIVSRHPGADVVFDVKSTRHLNTCITNCGGRPVMWKTGHSLMKQKMHETNAMVGAEYSGHIFIKDRWFGFDDGMYAAARLLEVLSLQDENIDDAFSEFPESMSTPEIRVAISEEKKFRIIEELKKTGDFGDGRLTLLDGVRADFSQGWGLVRASNTAAELTMRFEADDEQSMHKLKSLFVRELRKIDTDVQVNWN